MKKLVRDGEYCISYYITPLCVNDTVELNTKELMWLIKTNSIKGRAEMFRIDFKTIFRLSTCDYFESNYYKLKEVVFEDFNVERALSDEHFRLGGST